MILILIICQSSWSPCLLVVDDGDGEGDDDACHDDDSNGTQDTIADDIVKVAGLLFGDDFGR